MGNAGTGIAAISLLSGTLMVILGSFFFQKAWHRDNDAAEAFIAGSVIGFSWLTISGVILGVAGYTSNFYRMIIDVVFLTLSLISYTKFYPLKKHIERNPGPLKSFPVMIVLALGVAICIALWVWGWVSPPPAWDAFVYHLGFPASWLRQGHIFLVTVPFGDQAGTYFPSNVELVYLWLMTYTGQDFATNVVQWFFMLVSVCAVYRLSRLTGASQAVSLCASFAIFFMPSIAHQAVASEVDVSFSAMFVTSLYFLLRWNENPTIKTNLVLSLAAAGLLAGTKTISLPWIVFLYLPVLIVLSAKRGIRPWMLGGVAAAAATGGFWYIRNFIVTGNPIFPLSISIAGIDIFPGAYTRDTMLNSVFHTDSFTVWFGLLSNEWGIPLLVLTVVSIIFVCLGYKENRLYRLSFGIMPLLILLMVFFLVPYNREVRFTYTAFMLGCVGTGIVVSRSGTGVSRALWLVPMIYIINMLPISGEHSIFFLHLITHMRNLLSVPNEVYGMMRTAAGLLFLAAVAMGMTVYFSLIRQNWISSSKIMIAVSVVLAFGGLVSLSSKYPKYQYMYYSGTEMGQSWQVLHRIYPDSIRVAYSGTDLSYGLFGPRLKNSVYHIPVNGKGMNYFHVCNRALRDSGEYTVPESDRIDFCRKDPDFSVWFDKLSNLKTDVLYVTVLHQNDLPHLQHDHEGFPVERLWADSHPDLFKPVFFNRQVRVYEILY